MERSISSFSKKGVTMTTPTLHGPAQCICCFYILVQPISHEILGPEVVSKSLQISQYLDIFRICEVGKINSSQGHVRPPNVETHHKHFLFKLKGMFVFNHLVSLGGVLSAGPN